MKILLISLYSRQNLPLNSFYAMLEKRHDVRIIFFKRDLTNYNWDPTPHEWELLYSAIDTFAPDVVCTSVLTPFFPIARVISRHTLGKYYTIWGGKHCIINPESCVPYADAISVGEADTSLPHLLELIERGEPVTGCTGYWFNRQGQVHRNPIAPLLEKLDELPFGFVEPGHAMLIDDNRLYTPYDPGRDSTAFMLHASRGCVYQCSYCCNGIVMPLFAAHGRYRRLHSVKHVIAELLEAKKRFALKQIIFVDEIFAGFDAAWRKEFSEHYPARVALPFSVEVVPELITEPAVTELRHCGLAQVNFGIQSISERVRLEIYRRPSTDASINRAAAILAGTGVGIIYDIILNNPLESADDLAAGFAFLLQLPRGQSYNVYNLQLFPGYVITEIARLPPPDENQARRNWLYRPQLRTWTRKEYCENLLYLFTRNSLTADDLQRRLRQDGLLTTGYIKLRALAAYYAFIYPFLSERIQGRSPLFARIVRLGRTMRKGQLLNVLRQKLHLSDHRTR